MADNFLMHFIKIDPTSLRDINGQFTTTHVSNRNVLNVGRIKGIAVLSLSANFNHERNYDKVVEIVTNYSNNFVWSSNGQSRERRAIPLCTLHLKKEQGKKYFNWNNPQFMFLPVTNPDEILNLWCKDVFTNQVINDNIELSLLLCLKICPP